jgi:sigma-B regulation protein RsbU (phosphoserine phosphatase)
VTGSFSGAVIALGALVKLVAFAATAIAGPSGFLVALDTVGDLGLVIGALAVGYRLFVNVKRRLLWRVRDKLTLSYLFIGFVPALLIITFFLLVGLLLLNNLSSYLINSRVREMQDQSRLLAQMAALSIDRTSAVAEAASVLEARQRIAAPRYPGVSYAIVPAPNPCAGDASAARTAMTAGTWAHGEPPSTIPAWVTCDGYAGTMLYTDESRRVGSRVPARLMVRAVAWPPSGRDFAAVVDMPINAAVTESIRDDSGIEITELSIFRERGNVLFEAVPPAGTVTPEMLPEASVGRFRQQFDWFTFLTHTEWESGTPRQITVRIRITPSEFYERITPAELGGAATASFGGNLLLLVAIVGVLFLVIQLVAFGMGLGLARSITGAVHELFEGTERVRRGDFGGLIAVRSRDQMGQLAASFNDMTASIEDLLQQKAEKERLEQELLIARRIQMSLLPQGGMAVPGMTLTAHCEPAREVGGDYYDFLPIDDYTFGVLIADVSGKGTSAALYMAELKGIVLSLSQRHSSPRDLLIEADRIISRHLDSRSFITVSYVLVDLRSRTMRYARAGHCPMIYMPGPYATVRAPMMLTPDGLVLGLQLDEGRTFTRLLEEVTLPLGPGDVFLLYTDGMSEAMNPGGDCFGDTRLADVIGRHADLSADELRERILRELEAFAGSAAQHDDMTMVLIRVDERASA